MPVKRRLTKARLDVLNLAQLTHLEFGDYLIAVSARSPGFEDDDHRREAWEHHRDRIMVGTNHRSRLEPWVGRRPAAYWSYDRAMPPEAESESHAVYLLPDTSAEERVAIERLWLEEIRHEVRFRQPGQVHYATWRDPPKEFRDRNLAAAQAEVAAERQAERVQVIHLHLETRH
jgi:hypothetical protein